MRRFFEGRAYPALVALLCLASHITSLEWLFGGAVVALASFSLVFSESLLPLISPTLFICYHISRIGAAVDPKSSDYYFSGAGIFVFSVFVAVILASLCYRLCVMIGQGKSKPCLPFAFSGAILFVSLLLCGAGSAGYTPKNLALALFVSVGFFFFFYLFYIGLLSVDFDRLLSYFCYVTAVSALLISAELLWLYLSDGELIAEGQIVKERIVFGWGIWNTAGSMLSLLIPTLFLGAIRSGRAIYIACATIAYASAVFTLSRNAIVLSTAVYIISLVVAMLVGKIKSFARGTAVAILSALLLAVGVMRERIARLFRDILERGFSDNGRFSLWHNGILDFLSAPIFGRGFYGVTAPADFASSLPGMLHSTPIQLLASSGVFGFFSYLFYRVRTVLLVICHPSTEKSMLALSVLTILLGSLIDNFVFYLHQMLYPSIALALICLCDAKSKKRTPFRCL